MFRPDPSGRSGRSRHPSSLTRLRPPVPLAGSGRSGRLGDLGGAGSSLTRPRPPVPSAGSGRSRRLGRGTLTHTITSLAPGAAADTSSWLGPARAAWVVRPPLSRGRGPLYLWRARAARAVWVVRAPLSRGRGPLYLRRARAARAAWVVARPRPPTQSQVWLLAAGRGGLGPGQGVFRRRHAQKSKLRSVVGQGV